MFSDLRAAATALLLLSISVLSSAAATLPEPGLCMQLAQTSTWQAAHQYHEQCKGYHPTFFKLSLEVVGPLDIGEWYTRTIQKIYLAYPEYRTQNVTEAYVFARTMAGDTFFDCNLLQPDCGQRVTPRGIVHHLQATFPEWTNQQLMYESRNVKFALDMVSTINRIVTSVYECKTTLEFLYLTRCRNCSKSSKQMKVI